MPGAVWPITIKPGATAQDPATFDPPTLKASPGDVVSWNNATTTGHQIWQLINAQGYFLPMPIGASGRWPEIPPGGQSPAWTVPQPPGQIIYYGCVLDFKTDAKKVPFSTEIGTITT
jgi:plastocyanin